MMSDIATLAHRVAEYAALTPHKIAVDVDGDRLSYFELDNLGGRIGSALLSTGLRPGDAVGIVSASNPVYLGLMVGAARIGLVVVPLPAGAEAPVIAAMAADADIRLLFADRDLEITARPTVRIDAGFEVWLADAARPCPFAEVAEDTPATIIYSSGTTGAPKGVVQSHGVRWRMMAGGATRGYLPDSVVLLATPLYSNMTLASVMHALGAGGSVVLMTRFEAGAWMGRVKETSASHTTLAPVMIQRLLAHPGFDAADLSSLLTTFVMSAPFPLALKQAALSRWPGEIVELYGLTEGGPNFMLNLNRNPDKLHTVGVAVPGSRILILDDQDRTVQAGEQGEIVGRSGALMTGYHNQAAATQASRWTDADGLVWQRSGDIGRIDAEGFLTLVDRKKDMIISGGFNIYPSDIEAVAAGHPAILEVAVTGVDSEQWGETPVAFAVAPDGDAREIRDWINARVGKVQRVSDVRLLGALPRGPIGKVLKRELRQAYARG